MAEKKCFSAPYLSEVQSAVSRKCVNTLGKYLFFQFAAKPLCHFEIFVCFSCLVFLDVCFSVVQTRSFIICSNVDKVVFVFLFGFLMINAIFARSFASKTEHICHIIVLYLCIC